MNTDLEIYQARLKEAQDRIEVEERNGRSANKEDLRRVVFYSDLIAVIEKDLAEVQA